MIRQSMLLVPFLLAAGCGKPTISGNNDASTAPVLLAAEPAKNERAKEEPTNKEAPADPLAVAGTFHFPDDEGGKILAKILPPQPPALMKAPEAVGPKGRNLPANILNPEVPSAANSSVLPRIPLPTKLDSRPMPLPDRVPLELAQTFPNLPERIEFPVGSLTKWEMLDVKQPAPLSILARPTPDRASLDDPTLEFTAQSILNNKLPLRSTEAPFVKVNLPDPFENVEAAKVKVAIKQDPLTALGNPPPPKP